MRDLPKIIQNSAKQLYVANKRKKEIEKEYEEVRRKEQSKILKYMQENNLDSFEMTKKNKTLIGDTTKVKFTKVVNKKVVWNINKLKQKINKNMFQKIVNKTYIIKDYKGLVDYLKICNVNPEIFKTFIEVQEQLNVKEVDKMYETGKLKIEQVHGCFDVKEGNPYIKITEKQKDD